MAGNTQAERSPLQTVLLFLLVVVAPLVAGLYLASTWVPQPKVGIIRLNTEINAESTYLVLEQLAYAKESDSVEAVVFVLNSPGGSAAFSEELFLNVLQARADFPIISSIDLGAASGAYYLAAATDEIYAKPTSSVGSVGVIASLPPDILFVEEDLLTTGPYKAFGSTRDMFIRQMERSKFAFLEAVELGRGDRLVIDLPTLSRAEIFNGVEAVELGLADGLLSTEEAVERAAELAGIRNYETVELFELAFADDNSASASIPSVSPDLMWSTPRDLAPGIYYLYVEGQ